MKPLFSKIFTKPFLSLLLISNLLYSKSKEVDFSIVISGGVSLGAYEAGYNWAMIKMLNKLKASKQLVSPNLRSIAGASAGSINALLTGMYWCQKETISYNNTIEKNLFYDIWVNLGLNDLLIKGKNRHNRSSLFSRKILEKKAKRIIQQLNQPIYQKGCAVPLGISVTKATPMIEEFQGIQIKNQHFSVPLLLKEKSGKLTIHNKKMAPSSDFYISIPDIEKQSSKINRVLFASSAFPAAFQQVKLQYIYQGKRYFSYFIDGGAYDNIPLQLAIELNPKAKKFLFIDPSNMRKEPKNNKKHVEKRPLGFFSANTMPLLDSVEIFQSMKLYEALNKYFKNQPSRTLLLSSRKHPLTGNFLWHFGAFLDQNFRIYDYYVGLYDAIYHLANSLKQKGHFMHLTQVALMHKLTDVIQLKKNPEAHTSYRLFLEAEFKGVKPQTTNRVSAIYNAFNHKKKDSEKYDIHAFKDFLSKLNMSYLPHDKNSFIAIAKKDIEHWYKKPLRSIVNRITTLENERAKVYPEHTTVAKATSIAAWAAGGLIKKRDGFDILPMNAPDDDKDTKTLRNILRALPNEIATDMTNGGFTLGYSSYWYKEMDFINGIESKFAYNHSENFTDFVRVDINAFKEYDDFIKYGVGVSFFGDVDGSFYKKESAYGLNAYVDFMDIFRLTYVRRFQEIEKHDYIYFGIENIPSLLYWLNR